jgi:hypothetical protein
MAKYPQFDQRNSSHYAESDDGWLQMEIPLSDEYYNLDFRIRFRFISDRAINYFGVLVDDISIYVTSTTENHAPRARFTAEWLDDRGEPQAIAYSKRLIDLPLPEFEEIRMNYKYQNLPNPEGSQPQGGIGFNADSKSSDTVQFDASYSFDPDLADADELSYHWDFGDDGTGSGLTPTYNYGEIPLEKKFEVTLTVSDDEGAISTDTLIIWIGNSPPEVKFTITDLFDTNHVLDEDGVAEVFYGDTLKLISDVTDPENDHIDSYIWEFYEEGNEDEKTTASGSDYVDFTVGVDHLYRDKEGDVPVMPPYNSNAVTYIIKLTATDSNRNEADYSLKVIVNPYAMHEFVSSVKVGATRMDASVNLIWRGDVNDAAPSSDLISSKPVFVYIDPVDSPDPNLATSGGIGLVYDIKSVGCTLQNGKEGFKSAEIRLPILNADLEALGDSYSLSDDLRLEYYDKIEKRFFAVPNSHVMSDDGVKYVIGEVDHFSIYTAIVDTIYQKDPDVQPDLSVYKIEFSRSPAQNGQDVEVRVTIKNSGKISARNVDVKIYDGDDLVGDQRIDVVGASGDTVLVTETFIVAMFNPDAGSEKHTIKVYVNKQQAISEGSGNYKNNEGSEILEVTTVQTTTPSFESTALMMVVSSMMVVGSSMVALKKLGRRKDEE